MDNNNNHIKKKIPNLTSDFLQFLFTFCPVIFEDFENQEDSKN